MLRDGARCRGGARPLMPRRGAAARAGPRQDAARSLPLPVASSSELSPKIRAICAGSAPPQGKHPPKKEKKSVVWAHTRLCNRKHGGGGHECLHAAPLFFFFYLNNLQKSNCCSLFLSNAGVNSRKRLAKLRAALPGPLSTPTGRGPRREFWGKKAGVSALHPFDFSASFSKGGALRRRQAGEEHVQTVQRSNNYCFIVGEEKNKKENETKHTAFHQNNAVNPKKAQHTHTNLQSQSLKTRYA